MMTYCRIQVLLLVLSVIFISCEDNHSIEAGESGIPLSLQIEMGSFTSSVGTRINYNGFSTQFAGGDQIGITAVKNGAVYNGMDNVPFTYDAATSTWKPSDSSVLPQLYYYPDVTYIAYYPYDATTMNGKKSEQEMIDAFTPKTDQSTYANYTASDLMTGTGTVTGSNEAYTIAFKLEHRMSLFVMKAQGKKCVSASGGEYPVLPYDFSFKLNDTALPTYKFSDGTYRCMIHPTTASQKINIGFKIATDIPVSYEKTYATLTGGNYYSFDFNNEGGKAVKRDLQVGDFYYQDGSVLPKDATFYQFANNPCIGVVFYAGGGNGDNVSNYDGRLSAINGYVLALNHTKSTWGDNSKTWTNDNKKNYSGYSDTKLIKAGVDAGKSFPVYNYCVNFRPAPTGKSSGWYIPSIAQVSDFVYTNYSVVNASISKLPNPVAITSDWGHLSTTEVNAEKVYVRRPIDDNKLIPVNKGVSYRARAILTF